MSPQHRLNRSIIYLINTCTYEHFARIMYQIIITREKKEKNNEKNLSLETHFILTNKTPRNICQQLATIYINM